MKQEGLKERVELLEAGERLGFPRLGYGRSTKVPHDKRIPQGQDGWEKFCAHAHIRRVLPALRIARVLRDNGVTPYHPLSGREVSIPVAAEVLVLEPGSEARTDEHGAVHIGVDLLSDIPADMTVDISKVAIPDSNTNLVTPPRPKKGGHKKPPHPLSARARRMTSG